MTITVTAPNGATVDFPDGTDHETINSAMVQHFGGAQAEKAATGTKSAPLDDTEHAAGPLTIARASLPPDPKVQMQRYAEAFKQPLSDFGIVGDHIVRKIPDTGQYARVQPSVRGATGPIDAAERAFDWVAGGAGPTIPAVESGAAATLAALATAPETGGVGSLPAAILAGGAGGSLGEIQRQKLDAALAPKGQEAPIDLGTVGEQAVFGAAGPAAGRLLAVGAGRVAPAIGKMLAGTAKYDLGTGVEMPVADAVGQSAAESADAASPKSFGLSPRVVDALKAHIAGKEDDLAQLRQDAQALGVDLSLGQLTGSKAVQQSERQLIRQPETVQAVTDLRAAQNEEQIPGAVRKVMDEIAPDGASGQQVGAFRDAAGKVVGKALKDQATKAGPVYEAALDNKPAFWSDELTDIMKRPSMQAGWEEAQKDAAEEGRILPDLFSKAEDGSLSLNEQNVSWRDWQNLKIGMRKAVTNETDEMTGKMTPEGGRLQKTLKDMMGVLYKANPEWKAADAMYGSASDATDAILEGGVGFINKMSGPDRQNMVNRIFSGQNLMPEDIAAMRRQFVYAGKGEEWLGGVRSYIADKLAAAMTPTQTGELSNVGGKLYQGLWGDQRQAEIMKSAFGGSADDSFIRQWDKLGNVLRAAARQLPEGSPTATDTAAPGLVGKAVGAVKAILHPNPAAAADLIDGLTKIKDPEQAKRLAETLLTPAGDKLLKALAPTTPGTEKANSILLSMLTQAGIVEAEDLAAR